MYSGQRGLETKPKRTRICGPQSKYGCFTCRARRIKCDEEKPSCLRCARSGRECQGYPDRVLDEIAVPAAKETGEEISLPHRSQIVSSPSWALTTGRVQSGRQRRLAQCGLNLLSIDSFSRFGAAAATIDTLLPQLFFTIPSINSAAIALGAVYQWNVSHYSGSPVDGKFAASQYQIALRAMQRDLFAQPDGPIPLIMTCFILSVAEVLWQQEENALFHLRAGAKLLRDRRNAQRSSPFSRFEAFDTDLRSLEDGIGIILRTVDFQICSYAPSKHPDLPAISIPPALPSIIDLRTAHDTLVQLVHTCYNFTCTAYKFRYQPQSADPSIYIEQGRYIAHLSTWLEQFNLKALPTLHDNR